MKPKQLVSFLMLLMFSTTAFAQKSNPFASIGKKDKILTLTKGRYDESFDADSIQQIGTSLVNVRTMKVVKLLSKSESKTRLEGEKHSRFLSVDPLTSGYPMLTPYQYASNRPIDGKDIDGLEYVTYMVDIFQYENGSAIKVINYKWFNDLQHNQAGELGQGVTYDIRVHTSSGAAFQLTPFFVARQDKVVGVIKGDYGNYMGATSLYDVNSSINTKKFDNTKILTSIYSYDLPAVDKVDDLARVHDQQYDAVDAKGPGSLFNDWGTTPADIEALNGWQDFLGDYYTNKNNGLDPLNNQPITANERQAAIRGTILFSKVVSKKVSSISEFMINNFATEAKQDEKVNYTLFLNKYMHKTTNGTWERNNGMWSKQKDGTYTPNPTQPISN
jgi:hypothetical protein